MATRSYYAAAAGPNLRSTKNKQKKVEADAVKRKRKWEKAKS